MRHHAGARRQGQNLRPQLFVHFRQQISRQHRGLLEVGFKQVLLAELGAIDNPFDLGVGPRLAQQIIGEIDPKALRTEFFRCRDHHAAVA